MCSYWCSTLSLGKQLLPHRLFIKLWTSLHVGSSVLDERHDGMRRAALDCDSSLIHMFTSSAFYKMTFQYSHSCITWEKYQPYSGSHLSPSLRTYLTWPRALCLMASMSAMIQSATRKAYGNHYKFTLMCALHCCVILKQGIQMFYLCIGD